MPLSQALKEIKWTLLCSSQAAADSLELCSALDELEQHEPPEALFGPNKNLD